jgi:Xaa-Pro aminopeptidase
MASKIQCIKKACEIDDEIFILILKNIKLMKTEKDIDSLIRKDARRRNLKIAFPPVVASGKNASEIHHKPNKSKLKKGFLVLDFGVKVGGYCSDMTRTIYLGKASKKEKETYSKLLSIQKAAARKAKTGADCFEIDYFVRKKLGSMREYFLHSLGHGVGKKIHEKPNLSPKTADKLKKGDVVTVEPGIYLKNSFGIRIEDSILVAKTPKILTKSSKRLIEIK